MIRIFLRQLHFFPWFGLWCYTLWIWWARYFAALQAAMHNPTPAFDSLSGGHSVVHCYVLTAVSSVLTSVVL